MNNNKENSLHHINTNLDLPLKKLIIILLLSSLRMNIKLSKFYIQIC